MSDEKKPNLDICLDVIKDIGEQFKRLENHEIAHVLKCLCVLYGVAQPASEED